MTDQVCALPDLNLLKCLIGNKTVFYVVFNVFKRSDQVWSMVQSAIGCKADGSDMYTNILEAAEQRSDHEMLTRLHGVPNGDLVAVEARYHRQSVFVQHTLMKETFQQKQNKTP